MPPEADRPYMPDYPIGGPTEGRGLLPWSWAEERLVASRDYWLCTTRPDGRPHVMPVWGIWADDALSLGAGPTSRKVRNLEHDPRCAVAIENAVEPVVVEGVAERVTDRASLEAFVAACNAKYEGSEMTIEFMEANACFRVRPVTAFGLVEAEFTTSPTRWRFG